MPMLRAVPSTCLIAPSRSMALRSFILSLGDLAHLVLRHLANLAARRVGRALLDSSRTAQQVRRRRRLGDEGERAIFIDRDHDRNDLTGLLAVRSLYSLTKFMIATPC